MSSIKLESNASGTGIFTIASPNSNTNRTLTLPDSTGTVVVTGGAQTIEFAAGSASTPSITTTGDTNTGIFFPAADVTGIATGGTERMRITSDGYVKASTTGSYFSQTGNQFLTDTDSNVLFLRNTSASMTNAVVQFDTERNTTNGTYNVMLYYNRAAAEVRFKVLDSGNVQNINNSYAGTSDIKLKQDIVDAGSQWNDIKNLQVRKYRWKSSPDGFMQLGLVAQEAELISPGLIDEHPDYEEVEVTDADGNVTIEKQATGTTTKAIKYSVLYMKAVKALQEAMDRIETLETKVAALEAK